MADNFESLFGLTGGPSAPKTRDSQPAAQAGEQAAAGQETTRPSEPRIAPVPENQLNIKHPVYLQMVEDVTGGMRAHELRIGDAYLPGDLTTQHLRQIHAYVMQDVYAEPGATRGDELLVAQVALQGKPDAKLPLEYDTREGAHGQLITLVPAGKVNERLEEISERLRRENYLGGLDKPKFVARLTDYYLEYSKVAPFRSGNEHVLSVVLNQIGEEAGYIVAPTAAKHLREVTDATLAAGLLSDRSRLMQVLSSVTEEQQGQEALIRRKATQWALPAETTAGREKRVREDYGG